MRHLILLSALLALTLTACGTRGGLVLPPGPPPPPLFGNPPPAPAKPAQKPTPEADKREGAGDLNTPQEAR